MIDSEPEPIERATLILTAALGGQKDAMWDEIERIVRRPRLAAEVMAHLAVFGAATAKVLASNDDTDPEEFLRAHVVDWLRKRDEFEAGGQDPPTPP